MYSAFCQTTSGTRFAEGRVANIAVQGRDLRWLQSLLDLVDTLEQALQCVPGMEAGRPWVAEDMPLRETRTLRRVRELLFQEREVGGDFHRGLKVSSEGAGLQRGKEGVEFGEVGSLAGLLLLDGLDDGGEVKLKIRGWNRKHDGGKEPLIHLVGTAGRSCTTLDLPANPTGTPYILKIGSR